MKTIGLVGGMGWEGSAAYYRIMNRETRSLLGGWHSARVILDSLDFDPIAQAQSRQDYASVRQQLVQSAQRLELAGAQMVVIACNTVHRFAGDIEEAISIPLLHIATPARDALASDGHRKVGLLGTRATMQGRFYRESLQQASIEVVVPNAETQAEVHSLILNELAAGLPPEKCAGRLSGAIGGLQEKGCTAVLLACTEFGLVYGGTDAAVIHDGLPLFDTGVLHAKAAVRLSLESV